MLLDKKVSYAYYTKINKIYFYLIKKYYYEFQMNHIIKLVLDLNMCLARSDRLLWNQTRIHVSVVLSTYHCTTTYKV